MNRVRFWCGTNWWFHNFGKLEMVTWKSYPKVVRSTYIIRVRFCCGTNWWFHDFGKLEMVTWWKYPQLWRCWREHHLGDGPVVLDHGHLGRMRSIKGTAKAAQVTHFGCARVMSKLLASTHLPIMPWKGRCISVIDHHVHRMEPVTSWMTPR